ncbi:MAG: helix-turn-helix transcriptional regulator [Gemmatimonadota bacterium]
MSPQARVIYPVDSEGTREGVPRESITHLVIRLRDLRGWNQKQLAERLGTHKNTVVRWEDSGPPHDRLPALAEAFGVSLGLLQEVAGLPAEIGKDPATELLDFLEYRLGRVVLASFLAESSLLEAHDVLGENRDLLTRRDADRVLQLVKAIRSDFEAADTMAAAKRALES